MKRRNHIVLTGATGFIGQRIVRSLLSDGRRVVALVRPGSPRRATLDPAVGIVETELRVTDARLTAAFTGAEAVIHVAGAVRGAGPADFRPANIEAVRAVAETIAALDTPPPMLLLSSLAAREPQLSDYAVSKHGGETALTQVGGSLEWTIFRPPAVYGPGDLEMRPLFRLVRHGWAPALGPVGQRIALLHADDLADAMLAWLDAPEIPTAQTFELHDGAARGGYTLDEITARLRPGRRVRQLRPPLTLLRLAARASRSMGRLSGHAPMLTPGKLRELRHPDWTCDNAAIHQALAWSPTRPLDPQTVARAYF